MRVTDAPVSNSTSSFRSSITIRTVRGLFYSLIPLSCDSHNMLSLPLIPTPLGFLSLPSVSCLRGDLACLFCFLLRETHPCNVPSLRHEWHSLSLKRHFSVEWLVSPHLYQGVLLNFTDSFFTVTLLAICIAASPSFAVVS